MLEARFGQRPGWIIASSRALLSLLVILLAASDPGDLGLRREPDDIAALAYALFAFLSLLLCITNWWLAFRLRWAIFVLDLTGYLAVMYIIEPMHSGYFAASLALMSFLIVSTAMQWSWRSAIYVAIALNLLCIVMILEMALMPESLDYSVILRRQVYQIIVSFFLVWSCMRIQDTRLPIFTVSPSSDDATLFRLAVTYAMRHADANGGALCWTFNENEGCEALAAGNLAKNGEKASWFCSGRFQRIVPGPTMFDFDLGHSVTLESDRQLRAFPIESLNDSLIAQSGVRSGVFIPLDGATGRGRLILAGIKRPGPDFLRLAHCIGQELAWGMDGIGFQRAAEEMAIQRLRQSIARDLHDSVAQSLSGTRYWVQSIQKRLAGTAIDPDEFEQMAEALLEEQGEIRAMIERLRSGDIELGQLDLIEETEPLLAAQAQYWQVDIRFGSHPEDLRLERSLILEVRQLLREAISNAVRHGGATVILVDASLHNDMLMLKIRDNGSGFADLTSPGIPMSLDQRTQDLGGSLAIKREADTTEVLMTLPTGMK